MKTSVHSGIDHFLLQPAYRGARLALVTNDAALTAEGLPSRVALLEAGFTLVRLFSPEHGLSASGVDGAFQQHGVDAATGLPVISLYGDRTAPTEEDLHDIDFVLFDIPDVGCRFYTYLWTLTYVMEACATYVKPLVVLDRPNPISGVLSLAEGPWLEEDTCSSFIGRWNIPVRHSGTLGELAQYFRATRIKSLHLQVVKARGWVRAERANSQHFVPTSPAIRDPETALLYPGTGLLEGVNLNEGRGTGQPFKVCGAPWINSNELAEALANGHRGGIAYESCSYTPVEGVYTGQLCHGLKFSVTDPSAFRPVAMGVHLLHTLAALYPHGLKERLYRTRANPSGSAHLDKLLGVKDAFAKVQSGAPFYTDISREWTERIAPCILYPE